MLTEKILAREDSVFSTKNRLTAQRNAVDFFMTPMNTPKLLSITALLALALTGANSRAAAPAAPKQDVIAFKDPKAVYKAGGTGTIALAAAFASTGKAALTFTTTTPNIVSIYGTTATIKSAGTASITAVYPASAPAGYIRASDFTQNVSIAKAAAPKIAPVSSVAKPVYTQGAKINITLPSGKGLPADYNGSVSYSVTGPATVDGNGVVSLTGAGAVTVTVTPSVSPNYITAAAVPVKLAVAVGSATIGTISLPDTAYTLNKTVTIPTPSLTPSDATGGTWTFTTTAKTAKISGNTITLSGAGAVPILAAWSGNSNYAKTAKPVAIGSLNVTKGNDTITKTPIAAPAPGASITLPALKSVAGLPVVYSLTGSGAALDAKSGKVTPSNSADGSVSISGTTVATANFNAATPITYLVGWSYNKTSKLYSFSAQ